MGASKQQPRVVALLGVSGSGKAVVARRLHEHHGIARLRFGDPLRDMLMAGFDLGEAELDGDLKYAGQDRFGGCTPQHLFHTLAHNWARHAVHADTLAREWERRLAVRHGHGGLVLTDDLQRPNEAAAIRRVGGLIVRIHRPNFTPRRAEELHRQAEIAHDIQFANVPGTDLEAFADGLAAELCAAEAA